MKLRTKKMGILGGAFDPIHLGHLELARACQRFLALDQVRFIPSRQPVLKPDCQASGEDRAEMIRLAIANDPKFVLDERELLRKEPSYALLTLKSLREEFPRSDFYWLMGEDAYAEFSRWHEWREIAKLCNLVVVSRKTLSGPQLHHAEISQVFEASGHHVIQVQMPLVPVASRDIRENLNPHLPELPESVQDFILQRKLYVSCD